MERWDSTRKNMLTLRLGWPYLGQIWKGCLRWCTTYNIKMQMQINTSAIQIAAWKEAKKF